MVLNCKSDSFQYGETNDSIKQKESKIGTQGHGDLITLAYYGYQVMKLEIDTS